MMEWMALSLPQFLQVFFDFDGSMSFWKSNQVYSIYYYDRFYFGYCRYDCDWTIKRFFGLTYPTGVKPIETVKKFETVIHNFSTMNMDAVIVGVVSLVILIIAPYIFKRIPGSLLAVIALEF